MRFRSVLYVAAALLFQPLAACSSESDPATAPVQSSARATPEAGPSALAADEKRVVAFGDSLYAGYQLDPGQGFAPQLEAALDAHGVPARVVNAGVSGDTTAAGRQRLAFTLDGLERKPDLVLVGLGGNDMLRGIDPQQTRENMTAIMDELTKRGIPVMLTGMLAPPNLGPDYRATFESIYPDLAAKYDAPLYPFILDGVLGSSDLMLGDGIHPNPAGAKLIAGQVAPQVEAALTR